MKLFSIGALGENRTHTPLRIYACVYLFRHKCIWSSQAELHRRHLVFQTSALTTTELQEDINNLAPTEGFEPSTQRLEISCSSPIELCGYWWLHLESNQANALMRRTSSPDNTAIGGAAGIRTPVLRTPSNNVNNSFRHFIGLSAEKLIFKCLSIFSAQFVVDLGFKTNQTHLDSLVWLGEAVVNQTTTNYSSSDQARAYAKLVFAAAMYAGIVVLSVIFV